MNATLEQLCLVAERFWSHVDIRGPNECWPWKLSRTKDGYGNFAFNSHTMIHAHRFVLALKLERWPRSSVLACHECDNPPCCNPNHINRGTGTTNMIDLYNRQKYIKQSTPASFQKGYHNEASAILTWEQVKEIRKRYTEEIKSTFSSLGRDYNVDRTTITRIVRLETWIE